MALIAGLGDGRLERVGGMLIVKDPALGAELDQGRTDCLAQLNDLLVKASLPRI